ncbi:MAG TPA: DNA repair protein RecN [Opitutaceae bacterium]|nr:DNA repair protein RecN [Opitutaceae bacterium]
MLQSLRIRNLALLDYVSVDFEPGFAAVTGETGAGKSILIGALGLLAGERADKAIIRQGAPACEVEASLYFKDSEGINALLAELDLPACEEGLLVVKRSVPRERAPKITVNGGLATLAALQRIGERWIDFHGPSEPRRLLRDSCQLELLDLYGRAGPALGAYAARYKDWCDLQSESERIASEARLTPDELAFMETQLAKLDRLDLSEESIAALERDFQRMSRAQEIAAFASALEAGLSGEDGATARVAALVREARRLESIDPASRPLADRLASASAELVDLAAEYASLGRELQADPDGLGPLEERMNAWLEARRRHGPDIRSVAAARESIRRRVSSHGDIEGTLARLDRQIEAAAREARKAAAALRAVRRKAAGDLAAAAAAGIAELGFEKAEFRISITDTPGLGPTGDCGCEFLFSPNVGEPPLPLSRIASSGELARVMLALKAILAELDAVPVLVFDEVDANVGGEIGSVVGERMAAIGTRHQVLCVTHLPQVAAQAAGHFVVMKDQSGDRAVVTIEPIHGDRRARVGELARMLGDRNAKSALAHAEKLLRAG